MELRAEPRFGTRSSAVLEVIRDKVYTYDATITEVSGIGLRIEMTEELTEGEDIRLLVNNYLLLARVRRCIPSESGFIIGVERIDDWNGPSSTNALVPQKIGAQSPAKVLGRPKLKNPLDSLHVAAFAALFTDPRLRTRKIKYQTGFVAAVYRTGRVGGHRRGRLASWKAECACQSRIGQAVTECPEIRHRYRTAESRRH